MSPRRQPTNLAASVRARLSQLARRSGVELQLVLSAFATERLLDRLGVSPHAERFVLKGAALFRLWTDERRRATWDLDLHGRGASGVPDVVAVLRDLCGIAAEDGIAFVPESVSGEEIRVPDEYDGVRVRLEARLAEVRIPVQVDVDFGDAIVPSPTRETYPTLLDHAAPRILVYPREAVVAEKFEAMVSLGVTNSRMKDFYDVHRLASCSAFDGPTLARAVRATFDRCRTPLPDGEPLALAPGFLAAPERQLQWRAFLRRGRLKRNLPTWMRQEGLAVSLMLAGREARLSDCAGLPREGVRQPCRPPAEVAPGRLRDPPMLVADPWHRLAEDGSLPPSPRRLRTEAIRVARLIEYGGPLRPGEAPETLVECRRRPGGRACDGVLVVAKRPDGSLSAGCPVCGKERVRISNWERTRWARGPAEPVAWIAEDRPEGSNGR